MTPSITSTPAEFASARFAVKQFPTPRDQVDGAWWPTSRDLAVEVGALLDGLAPRVTPTGRVVFNLDDWECPRARMDHHGALVRLDGYRFWPTHLVKIRASRDVDAITLMVVPPDTAVDVAETILARCSADDSVVTVDDMMDMSTGSSA